MGDAKASSSDPRWGQVGRDQKAQAICETLRLHCGHDLKSGVWLDIGCGSGGIAATLSEHAGRVVGVDPEAWERWQAFRDKHPNLEFHVGTYRNLDSIVGTESCDVVVCNQVYEHVDDPDALLAAIRCVLKPNGVCYFAGPNLLWPIEPHVFWPFVHWLPRAFAHRSMRALGSRHAQDLDAWSWSYWKLASHFRNASFLHTSVIPERLKAGLKSHAYATRVLGLVPSWLMRMLTPLAPGFVFVLKKRDA